MSKMLVLKDVSVEESIEPLMEAYTDITAPQCVSINIRKDGTVAWVNVNGVCTLRLSNIKELTVCDERISFPE